MNLVLIGISGSGKGTQAAILSSKYNCRHISTGELFRKEYDKKSPEGVAAYEYWGRGLWVPDEVTFALLKTKLSESLDGFVLDGFPRTKEQAEILDSYLKENNKQLDKVIYLQVGQEEALKRLLLRGEKDKKNIGQARADEEEEIIRKRFQSFLKSVDPILNYYKDSGRLIIINGEKSVVSIAQEISNQLT